MGVDRFSALAYRILACGRKHEDAKLVSPLPTGAAVSWQFLRAGGVIPPCEAVPDVLLYIFANV